MTERAPRSRGAKAQMQWASAVSRADDTRRAALEAAAAVSESLAGKPPDIAFVFLSPHHRAAPAAVEAALAETLLPSNVIGCTAGGVIGGGHEVEGTPGLSITAARL